MHPVSKSTLQELDKFGFDFDNIVSLVGERFDIKNAAVLLAGSIVDGLSSEESDVDVLIINQEEIIGPRSMIEEGLVVDTIGVDGGRLQIAQCSKDRLNGLVNVIETFLDPNSGQLNCLSTPEKRILHRVCNGISLHNHAEVELCREFVGKGRFANYCMVLHTYGVEAALKDALGEIKGQHWLSSCAQLQRAGIYLGMAVLNQIGETNQNPKWVTRLLQKNGKHIAGSILNTIQRGMFPTTDLVENPEKITAIYDELKQGYDYITSNNPELFTDKGSEV